MIVMVLDKSKKTLHIRIFLWDDITFLADYAEQYKLTFKIKKQDEK